MTKKILVLLITLCFFLPLVIGESLQVEKSTESNVIIGEMGNPIIFNYTVYNSDGKQEAELYSFVGIKFIPEGFFDLNKGYNSFEVKAYPSEEVRKLRGNYNFAYEIKGAISGITKDGVSAKIIGLKDVLETKAEDISVGDNSVRVNIRNIQNIVLDDLKVHFKSQFFDQTESISLLPFESKNITLKLDRENSMDLSSGAYVFSSEITLGNISARTESTLNYVPKENSVLTKSVSGLIIRKVNYTRTNLGNVQINGKIETTRDVLSRLFTINSVEPIEVERHALSANYLWEKSLQPGESYSVVSTTNYTFPFILILLIIIVALLVKMYTKTNLVVDKRVSYVKTRGGEFALKIKLHVKAKKYIENVQLVDRLPGMTQLYEKFGVAPDKIDHATKRLFWNVDRLNAGEERVYSYIIYSKVRVVGRFELPAATAVYLREGKTEQVFSNRTFFVAETVRTDGQ